MDVVVTLTKKQADELGLVYTKTEDDILKVGCKISNFGELTSLWLALMALEEI